MKRTRDCVLGASLDLINFFPTAGDLFFTAPEDIDVVAQNHNCSSVGFTRTRISWGDPPADTEEADLKLRGQRSQVRVQLQGSRVREGDRKE